MKFLQGVLENIAANFFTLALGLILGWVFLQITHRRQLLKFFGMDASRRIVIYLSNLIVKPFGTIGIDGQARSYEGSTVAFHEMLVANRFRELFNYILPSLSEKPRLLSKLLISDAQVELLTSPSSCEQLETCSFITIGGPTYNRASRFAETELHSRAQFRFGQVAPAIEPGESAPKSLHPLSRTSTIVVSSSSSSSTSTSTSASGSVPSPSPTCLPVDELDLRTEPAKIRPAILVEDIPPITDTAFGFVERIVDHEHKRCVLYAAGLSELGTVGAAHFLAREWARLYRKYRSDASFLVMLRFDRTDFRRWSIVFER